MQAHGDFCIHHHNNVLLTEVSGSWNQEATESYCSVVMKTAATFTGAWAHVVDARGWQLGVPECALQLKALSEWRAANGLVCLGYLDVGNELVRNFARANLLPQNATFHSTIETCIAQMREWLTQFDFHLPENWVSYLKQKQ